MMGNEIMNTFIKGKDGCGWTGKFNALNVMNFGRSVRAVAQSFALTAL